MSTEMMEQEGEAERLLRLVKDYESRLAEIRDLTAHIRHELNNPLTGVLGQTQLLLREELSPKARSRVEAIEALAIRIRDTVAMLRDLPPLSPDWPNQN